MSILEHLTLAWLAVMLQVVYKIIIRSQLVIIVLVQHRENRYTLGKKKRCMSHMHVTHMDDVHDHKQV